MKLAYSVTVYKIAHVRQNSWVLYRNQNILLTSTEWSTKYPRPSIQQKQLPAK